MFMQVYQDTPGVEHIPVVQIDLSVPLKVPGMFYLMIVLDMNWDYHFFLFSIKQWWFCNLLNYLLL